MDSFQLHPDAKRFENWENNYSALLGLGCAIEYALDIGLDNIRQMNQSLAKNLRLQLNVIEGVKVWDIGKEQCAIVSFSVNHMDAQMIVDALHEKQINVSCSRATSTLIDANRRNLPDLIRASVHYFNTPAQIDTFCQSLKEILNQ